MTWKPYRRRRMECQLFGGREWRGVGEWLPVCWKRSGRLPDLVIIVAVANRGSQLTLSLIRKTGPCTSAFSRAFVHNGSGSKADWRPIFNSTETNTGSLLNQSIPASYPFQLSNSPVQFHLWRKTTPFPSQPIDGSTPVGSQASNDNNAPSPLTLLSDFSRFSNQTLFYAKFWL